MERYDYRAAVKSDVMDWLEDNQEGRIDEDREQELNDILWTEDSVTGNGSGSYTFNRWRAEENLCHNADLVAEAYSEFGGDIHKEAESQDVTIRCYLLGQVLHECVEEWNSKLEDEEEAEEEK